MDKIPVHYMKMTYPGQMTGSNRGQQTQMVEQMVLDRHTCTTNAPNLMLVLYDKHTLKVISQNCYWILFLKFEISGATRSVDDCYSSTTVSERQDCR